VVKVFYTAWQYLNNMKKTTYKIDVNLKERSYSVFVGSHLLNDLPQYLREKQVNPQIALISTPPVADLYRKVVLDLFNDDWFVNSYDVPDGESSKSAETVAGIYTWLLEHQYERNSTIIALGGGVIGDLAGFVASTYLRGVNLIHIPTSLLAQVDSSIGGKVGINHPLGKNLIGAFYQPKGVFTDISFLKTLPGEEYICGLGEVIKYAILSTDVSFELIENNLDLIMKMDVQILRDIVHDCIKVKADIVEKDEKEQGIRAWLNLGHTFAHALETFYKYEGLKHGQAVLLGIRCALHVSQSLNMIDDSTVKRIEQVIQRMKIKIPESKKLDTLQLLEIMKRDKKMKDGTIQLVLPKKLGEVAVVPVNDEKLISDSYTVLAN
jgi:3-dehydroquinate synthase